MMKEVLFSRGNRLRLWVAFLLLPLWASPAAAQAPFEEPDVFWERAALYRDEWGTPHVYGGDYRSMAFAFGYAQAEDHLEAMLLAYRVAKGRAAEVFGEQFADSDEMALRMRHLELAVQAYANLDPLTQDLCEGFALGVNAYLVEHPAQAPPWADGVRPEDILALLHCYLMSFAPFELPDTYQRPLPAFSGNAWAIGPSGSDTQEAFLVVNPHGYFEGPFRWYEAHLICGDMNVAGATLFGIPALLMGHNEVLGWALTPNQADTADMYMEPAPSFQRDPKSLMGGEGFPNERLTELLLLESAQPYYVSTAQGLQERVVPVLHTGHGPIVGSFRGDMCAWQIGGYEDFGTLYQLVEMARARSMEAFQSALANHQLPCFHVVYADNAGNIMYRYNAKVGARRGPEPPEEPLPEDEPPPPAPALVDWTSPLPAGDRRFQWEGVVPPEVLPAMVNPASGYVQACGNPPWEATEDPGFTQQDLPYWLALDGYSYRAKRVRQLLGMGARSFRDCQSMVYDTIVPVATDIVPGLLAAASERADFVSNAHPDLTMMLDVLGTWPFTADTGSNGMTLFHAWWNALHNQAGPGFAVDDAFCAAVDAGDPNAQILMLNAANETARMMRNEYRSVAVPWGDVHTVQRGEREAAMAGAVSGEPVFTVSDYAYEGRKWRATYGYGFAMAVRFGERPEAVSMVPFGASEDPESPHYADQLDLMSERRFKVTRFEHVDIQRHTTRARGRLLYLRPLGVEGVFTLQSAGVIEARLEVETKAPAALPDGLVPFTLFMRTRKVPRETPMQTHMLITVPDVLCAPANLEKLAVYVYDDYRKWTPVKQQEVNEETRTFSASESGGDCVYAVLGPSEYRTTRLSPGTRRLEDVVAQPPAPAAASQDAPSQSAPSQDAPSQSAPSSEGEPPAANLVAPLVPRMSIKKGGTAASTTPDSALKRERMKPFALPPELADSPSVVPPQIEVILPEDETTSEPKEAKGTREDVDEAAPAEVSKAEAETPQVKRNFNVGLPGKSEESRPRRTGRRTN